MFSYIGLLISWIISYILGGLSFVFLLAIGIWSVIWLYGSTPVGDLDPSKRVKTELESAAVLLSNEKLNPTADLEGIFVIRRRFHADPDAASANSTSAQASQFLSGKDQEDAADVTDIVSKGPVRDGATPAANITTSTKPTYAGRVLQTYRSFAKTTAGSKLSDLFIAKLKGSVMFVYKYEKNQDGEHDCVAALTMEQFTVAMEDQDGPWEGLDGRLFAKRHAIVLRKVHLNSGEKQGLGVLAMGMSENSNTATQVFEDLPWFMFSKSNIKTEDFYLAMLNVSANPPGHARVYSNTHMQWFIDQVENRPDRSKMDWFNIFVGRLFLGINQTALVEQAIMNKINKKLAFVQHPLIGPLVVTEVNVGHIPPIFSEAMLKETKPNGEIAFEMHLDYRQPEELPGSGVRITIEATRVGIKAVLAVLVKSISGNIRVIVKAPPTNRFWWGFTEDPQLELAIEPVVGSRSINLSMLLSFIERKMREGLRDTIVVPNMDDTPFFSTAGMEHRGGIFDEASKHVRKTAKPQEKEDAATDDEAETRHSPAPSFPPPQRAQDDTDIVDRYQLQRAETTPTIGVRKTSATGTGSKRMSAARPAAYSLRKEPLKEDNSQSTMSSVKGFDPGSSSIRSNPSIASSDIARASSPSSETSQETPREAGALTTLDSPSKVSTQSLLNAVRARDKVVIQTQVSSAKDNVKKWGVSFMAKRRAVGAKQGGDGDEGSQPSSYYVPSEDTPPAPLRTSDGRTLQERLEAAAHNASTSPRQSTFPRRPSSTMSSQPEISTSPKVAAKDNSSVAELLGSSPPPVVPTISQPTVGRTMMVPMVPKRPGVATAIANDSTAPSSSGPASTASTATPASTNAATAGAPPALPARAAPAPPKVSTGGSFTDTDQSSSSEEPVLVDLSDGVSQSGNESDVAGKAVV